MHVTGTLDLEISLEGQALGFYRALDPLEQAVFWSGVWGFLGFNLNDLRKSRGRDAARK